MNPLGTILMSMVLEQGCRAVMAIRGRQEILNVILVCSLLLVPGCSTKFMYNNLDWIIPWYLDDYVSLTAEQEKIFDQVTEDFLRWHRQEELPRYAEFLTELEEALQAPLTRNEVLQFFNRGKGLLREFKRQLVRDIVVLAKDLSDEQVAEIEQALGDQGRELRQKYGERQELEVQQLYRKRTMETLEDWLGTVLQVQKQLVVNWSRARMNTTDMWLEQGDRWRAELIFVLRSRGSEGFARDLETFLLKPQQRYPLAYRQAIAVNRVGFAQLVAELTTTLTPDQRTFLRQRLAELIEKLDELGEQ